MIGSRTLNKNWEVFTKKVEKAFSDLENEEFDGLVLKSFGGIEASQFNYIL